MMDIKNIKTHFGFGINRRDSNAAALRDLREREPKSAGGEIDRVRRSVLLDGVLLRREGERRKE